jgi:hypothetical protein
MLGWSYPFGKGLCGDFGRRRVSRSRNSGGGAVGPLGTQQAYDGDPGAGVSLRLAVLSGRYPLSGLADVGRFRARPGGAGGSAVDRCPHPATRRGDR